MYSFAPAAAAAYAASEPDRLHALPAHCEPASGGPLGPGPSMVPLSETFSTPPITSQSVPPLGVQPSAAYPPGGPLPLMAGFVPIPPSQPSRQYPTPGVAYAPLHTPLHLAHTTPPHPYARDPRDDEIARLNAELQALAGQVRHLTRVATMSPSPQLAMQLHMPPTHQNLHHPLPSNRPPSPPESMASFATITSSSKMPEAAAKVCGSHRSSRCSTIYSNSEASEREADEQLMPMPAAAGDACMDAVATRDEIFSSKELTGALACSGEPDTIAAWDVTIMGRLKAKNAVAHRVLLYTEAEIAAMSPSARAVHRGYDSVLAGHFLAVLYGDTPRVKLLRATIAAREKAAPGTVTSSGRAVRNIILELIAPTCGSELEQLELELDKTFFDMSMGEVAVKLAAKRYEALRAQLPPTAQGGERELLRGLLAKFPEQLAVDAKDLKKDMRKAEVTKKAYDWNYEQLTSMLASLIADARPAAEANTTDLGRGGGGGTNIIGTLGFTGCLSCGLDNHISKKCIAPPCTYCGMRICFGARKRGPMPGCLVKKLVGGGKIDKNDIGLNGKPLFGHLLDKIKERAEEIKAKKGDAEANAASQTEKIDDDDEGAYESELCELDVCC